MNNILITLYSMFMSRGPSTKNISKVLKKFSEVSTYQKKRTNPAWAEQFHKLPKWFCMALNGSFCTWKKNLDGAQNVLRNSENGPWRGPRPSRPCYLLDKKKK